RTPPCAGLHPQSVSSSSGRGSCPSAVLWGDPRAAPTSFYGRFRHFLDIIDPRTLFVTEPCLLASFRLETISSVKSRSNEARFPVGLCLTAD
uniref:Uncharacterized protein n=1 Tax=Melopsittacus undulatus TaxID=13146 RepID=A0A8C6J757_MELUD